MVNWPCTLPINGCAEKETESLGLFPQGNKKQNDMSQLVEA